MTATFLQRLSAVMTGLQKEEHLLLALPWDEPKEQMQRIRKRFPYVKISYHQSKYGSSYWKGREPMPPEFFESGTILATLWALPATQGDAPNLRLIHFFSAGVDHVVDNPIYRDSDITLTTSSGIHGPQIAEWVVMTALASGHKLSKLLAWQRERHWGSLQELGPVRDNVGQRLGVLGYGSIGRQVARVAKAMGTDVIAYTASPRPSKESKKDHGFVVPGTGDPDGELPSAWYSGHKKEELHHFLRQNIDILLVSVPLTTGTTHLLGKEEFDILGKSRNAFISNISRGPILRQDDLIAALKASPEEGGLRGAALDVADPEPLPADNELWSLPNVILSPHISGGSTLYVDRCFQVLEENLARLEKGQKLINVVDRKKGY
ncbi:MAG: hypothetical protein M1833_002655 [Piccolia ochrophora]|nr:MAG: hypothetical protein M1833_002655 [Piccolia ochrophora]